MSKKKRKPLPRTGGKTVAPTTLRTARTPKGQELTNKLSSGSLGKDFAGYGHLETPEVNMPVTPGMVTRERLGLPFDASNRSVVDAALVEAKSGGSIGTKEYLEVVVEGLARRGQVIQVPTRNEPVMFNPIDLKARVVDDLRHGRVDSVTDDNPNHRGFTQVTARHAGDAVLIDVQSVYERWMAANKGHDMYEMVLAPPWPNAVLMYNNSAGNVWALHMLGSDIKADGWAEERPQRPFLLDELKWQPQAPADHTIDWDLVRWVYSVQVYCGGIGQHGKNGVALSESITVPTIGPLMIWRIAVYEDGSAADVHWSHLAREIPMHKFNNALGVLTETLNMCNCVNVHVTYPDRPMQRAQRRRLDRMGVRFSEVHIKPVGKGSRGKGEALADMVMPIHGVRGHYATYGKDGRGLLFGKYAGRYWIPPHVRGSRDNGEVVQSYVTD